MYDISVYYYLPKTNPSGYLDIQAVALMEFPCFLFNDLVEESEMFVFESLLQLWQSNVSEAYVLILIPRVRVKLQPHRVLSVKCMLSMRPMLPSLGTWASSPQTVSMIIVVAATKDTVVTSPLGPQVPKPHLAQLPPSPFPLTSNYTHHHLPIHFLTYKNRIENTRK